MNSIEKDIQDFLDWCDNGEYQKDECKIEHKPYGDLITFSNGEQFYYSFNDRF